MQVSKIEELTLNEIEQVNGGIAPLAFPLAYKAFVAGAAFGSGLVMAAYKMVE
ncbi:MULTISPECIES: class IIb bacteriocin, lactobin A/cerein 7B family [Shewanella]|uniref:class IIb bacteriocin, lactobin A/cerein 7B family n=1 Tax=Shewanella TaxID=22 RepID=UPI0009DC9F40|nr:MULTISPECIES: class IIb bacteriocin, lactobin A/cerein 7B family [Shewanella]NDO76561.1 class IIb bacteriocin, lactobin A/cerein 7B family [Shewanella sp. SE1]